MRQRVREHVHVDLPGRLDFVAAAAAAVGPGVPSVVEPVRREDQRDAAVNFDTEQVGEAIAPFFVARFLDVVDGVGPVRVRSLII